MVHKIIQTKWGVFLEALVITGLLLVLGISIGVYVESKRTDAIVEKYKGYEIESMDLRLQNYYYQLLNGTSCDLAIRQNFDFADDIYLTGLELEKYEEANQISEELAQEKKRYVLLKTELWLNTLLLKEKCNTPFDTVVYFYSGDPSSSALVAEQKVISNVLKDIKERRGNEIVLIPIAGDLDLRIVNFQRDVYNVSYLPSILINEKVILEGFHSVEEIELRLDED